MLHKHKKAPFGASLPNNLALEVQKEKEGVFVAFSALKAFVSGIPELWMQHYNFCKEGIFCIHDLE